MSAAEAGHRDAQFYLGACYSKGEGVPEDESEAAKWYKAAAEQGEPMAQFNLSVAYFCGYGVLLDRIEAHKWASLAATGGYPGAQKMLDKGGNVLSPDQIAEAQLRAANL